MTSFKLLAFEDAPRQGYNLPKFLSSKYRNLISADGRTYYMLPTPVKKTVRIGGGGKTKSEWLDFAQRYPGQGIEAIFVGVRRGMSSAPIDCSYTDAKTLLLHNTSAQEINSTVERFARFKSGAALAMFDMPATVRDVVVIKPKSAKLVVFSGKKGSKTVNVRVDFDADSREGGIACLNQECRGMVHKSFQVEVQPQSIRKHLWNGEFSVRLTEHGVLEFDSPDLDGTLYLGGKLVA